VARGVLAALGVRLRRSGPLPRPGTLLVANHVSWLDIVALLAVTPVKLVAKCEVRAWPGIGALAAALGAIFVDRSRPKSLPVTVAAVAAQLRAGRSVAVFPEGTTFCGAGRGRFRPAMFQAAVDAGASVVPVSITYDSTAAAFVGDDTLWSSVRRIAGLRGLTVTLVGAPALRPAGGADRRLLARTASVVLNLGFSAAGEHKPRSGCRCRSSAWLPERSLPERSHSELPGTVQARCSALINNGRHGPDPDPAQAD
jgi:1-acyl-sn-glycerol-3-phosphate acyltransferase